MNFILKSLLVIFITTQKCECLTNWLCDFLNNTSTSQISDKCSKQLNTVCRNTHLSWMMFDASSKYPYTGMSYGNKIDLGNHPECLSIKYEDANGRILGKHCGLGVVYIDLFIPTDLEKVSKKLNISLLNNKERVLKSKDTYLVLKKELETLDPVTYTMSKLSWCIPDACTPEEVGHYYLIGYTGLIYYTGITCETVESNTPLETIDIVVITILAIILLIMIVSTYYDILIQHQWKKEPKHQIFIAFSVYTNGRKLFKLTKTKSKEQIQCFNGLRTISMLWIISGHAIVAYYSLPSINTPEFEDVYMKNWRSQFISSVKIAVDTFFFMSGFLVAYSYFKSASKISPAKQVLGLPSLYLYRYIRLTPALLMVLLFAISTIRFLGSGPLWNVMDSRDRCERQWWEVLLYVQNYIHFDDSNMCLLHTWYLCADMQMFILAPLVLIPASMFIKKHFKAVIYSFIGLTIISFMIPIAIRLADHSITNNYDTHSRLSNYLIGITIATIMRVNINKPFPFSKKQNFFIWVIILIVAVGLQVVYFVDSVNYAYNTHYIFDSLYRPVWSTCLAWMVYSCHHGYGGIINGILKLPIFEVGARLSYCMYLVHAVVVTHHIALMRVPYYFSDYEAFFNWCAYSVITGLVCIVWTLAFEAPMITIQKMLFENFGKFVRWMTTCSRKVA